MASFRGNNPRGWKDIADDLSSLDASLRSFKNVESEAHRSCLERCLRLGQHTATLLDKWGAQASGSSYITRLDPRGWDAFETAEKNVASMRQQVMFLSMQVQNERLDAIDAKLDALLGTDLMLLELNKKFDSMQALLVASERRQDLNLSVESLPLRARYGPSLRRRRSGDDLRRRSRSRSISPLPSETESEPTISARDNLKDATRSSKFKHSYGTLSRELTRDLSLRRASTYSSVDSEIPNNSRLLSSVEDSIRRLILPELDAIKAEKKVSELEYNAHVEFRANVLNSKVPTLAIAIQDSKASINAVSSRFLTLHNLTRDEVEVLKPRPQPGRFGELMTADKAIELQWAPAGSKKWMKSEFFVTEDVTDYDIMLGKGFVDLSGMFDDTNVEVYRFKLPGRSRAQQAQSTVRTERSRRRNEELDEELRARDRQERSRDRMTRQVAARLAQTGSEPASSLAGTTGGLTPSTTATADTTGQATPVPAEPQGPELNPLPGVAATRAQPDDGVENMPEPTTS